MMNERIKSLAVQAGITFNRELEKFNLAEDIEHCDVQEFMLEKFAELIVKECADIAYNFGEPFEDGPGTKISDKIQEHFGVK
jgi:hypothetical protein